MREHTHDFESVVTLQNSRGVLQDECGSCIGTCQTLCGDEFTDIKVEEDPKPSTSASIQHEPVVSCVSSDTHGGQISRLFCHTACLSVHRIIWALVKVV